jgi:hypothetical protein
MVKANLDDFRPGVPRFHQIQTDYSDPSKQYVFHHTKNFPAAFVYRTKPHPPKNRQLQIAAYIVGKHEVFNEIQRAWAASALAMGRSHLGNIADLVRQRWTFPFTSREVKRIENATRYIKHRTRLRTTHDPMDYLIQKTELQLPGHRQTHDIAPETIRRLADEQPGNVFAQRVTRPMEEHRITPLRRQTRPPSRAEIRAHTLQQRNNRRAAMRQQNASRAAAAVDAVAHAQDNYGDNDGIHGGDDGDHGDNAGAIAVYGPVAPSAQVGVHPAPRRATRASTQMQRDMEAARKLHEELLAAGRNAPPLTRSARKKK